MQTSSNQIEQGPVSKQHAEDSPNETTLSFPRPLLLYVLVHCHPWVVFVVILVVFPAKLDINRSFVVSSLEY